VTSCERCWERSSEIALNTGRDQVSEYRRLIREGVCTPEQQAGRSATRCAGCGRDTGHQVTGECMNPVCPWNVPGHDAQPTTKPREGEDA